MENRPRSRERNVTGPAKGVSKHGSGLGTGPVGNTGGHSGGGSSPSGGGQRGPSRGKGGLIALLLALLLGGGGGLTALLGGQPGQQPSNTPQQPSSTVQTPAVTQKPPAQAIDLSQLLSGLGGGSVSSGWDSPANTGKLDTTVAKDARAKYTALRGGGRDTATIMVYMCGTDLESRSGMGTADLQEMLGASFGDNINLLVYTGGCKAWKNNAVSSTTNQIWQIKNGQMVSVKKDLGAVSMTDPSVLTGYIQFCAKNYPASRYELILWDHGGGSVTGYGYDEKFASSGSMDLAGLDSALKSAGVKFDFIGFDACLMATAETALTMAKYGDYLIASEETEPGVGWYYTDWLTAFGQDPSMSTVELGKRIVDSFVDTCAQKCRGQGTTLSVIDLAELEKTLPQALTDFSKSTVKLIQAKDYQTVSNARSGAREFAQSSRIDQVDLVHLAKKLGTKEGDALAEALLSAVKYNRTSSNMTNAYGVSIYFPYRKTSGVDKAARTFDKVDVSDDYVKCISKFADVVDSGQAVSGGAGSPLPALQGTLGGSGIDIGDISALLSGILGGRSLDMDDAEEYLEAHRFPAEALLWQTGDGVPVLELDESAWSLVQDLELNVFVDDGAGYIDLGLDNVFDFTDDGALLGKGGDSWLAVNGQPVAYYHTATVDDGTSYTITGYVPVLWNGARAELLLTFDNETPGGYVSGIRAVYPGGETEAVAKSDAALQPGDTLEFICDYYGYDGSYQDSYLLGDLVTVTEDGLTVSDVPLDAETRATYRFTDIYNQHYWTAPVPR